jgi:hypothetical protein
MTEIIIDASGLKEEGNETVQALANFLKEKTNAEITADGQKLTVKGEGAAVSKKYLRVIVKKFLHKRELKEDYRVISDVGEENALKVNQRKIYEE